MKRLLLLIPVLIFLMNTNLHAQINFSLGLIDGFGFDVGYVTKKHLIHLKFGGNIGINGLGKKGTNYTDTISSNQYRDEIKETFKYNSSVDFKIGKHFFSKEIAIYGVFGYGMKNTIQQRYDDTKILDVTGNYYIVSETTYFPNIGVGITFLLESQILLGFESTLSRPVSLVLGYQINF